jgi:hypothetical protein
MFCAGPEHQETTHSNVNATPQFTPPIDNITADHVEITHPDSVDNYGSGPDEGLADASPPTTRKSTRTSKLPPKYAEFEMS